MYDCKVLDHMVFIHEWTKPRGGWKDYACSFDEIEDAMHLGKALLSVSSALSISIVSQEDGAEYDNEAIEAYGTDRTIATTFD